MCKYYISVIEHVAVIEVFLVLCNQIIHWGCVSNWAQMFSTNFSLVGLKLAVIYRCDLFSFKKEGTTQKQTHQKELLQAVCFDWIGWPE